MKITDRINDMKLKSMKRIKDNQLEDEEFRKESRSYEEGYQAACREIEDFISTEKDKPLKMQEVSEHTYIINKIAEHSEVYMLTLLTCECATSLILKNRRLFPSDVEGKLIVDLILKSGNSGERFLVLDIHRGIVDYKNISFISSSGNSKLEQTANIILAQHPAIVLSSMLTDAEKVKILHTDYQL